MNLTNTLTDIFSAPRRALSLTKILIFFRANLAGYSMYLFANYLALILAGLSIKEIWINEGVYPCAYSYNIPWYSTVLFWISSINWILLIYGSIGVAAKVYRQIGVQLLRSKTSWHGPKQVTSKASKVLCTLKATLNLYRRFPHPRKPHNSNLHSWLKPNMRKGVS